MILGISVVAGLYGCFGLLLFKAESNLGHLFSCGFGLKVVAF